MAFICRYSTFKYMLIPLGLTNMPATIQYLMNLLFACFLNSFLTIYLDDLLVYSAFDSEHLAHLQTIFKHLYTL